MGDLQSYTWACLATKTTRISSLRNTKDTNETIWSSVFATEISRYNSPNSTSLKWYEDDSGIYSSNIRLMESEVVAACRISRCAQPLLDSKLLQHLKVKARRGGGLLSWPRLLWRQETEDFCFAVRRYSEAYAHYTAFVPLSFMGASNGNTDDFGWLSSRVCENTDCAKSREQFTPVFRPVLILRSNQSMNQSNTNHSFSSVKTLQAFFSLGTRRTEVFSNSI